MRRPNTTYPVIMTPPQYKLMDAFFNIFDVTNKNLLWYQFNFRYSLDRDQPFGLGDLIGIEGEIGYVVKSL